MVCIGPFCQSSIGTGTMNGIKCYNWTIANDTYVPLPSGESEAIWQLSFLEWLEGHKDYWLYYNFFPYFMTTAGHC